jgi:hypothetical protein
MDFFGNHNGSFFLNESSIVVLYSNLLEKLGKSEMKNWNVHSNLSNPKNNYQKDKYSIQGGIYKGWYIQCPSPNYPKKIIIIDFFLLMELETKLFFFTTTHWSTITLNMKKSTKKNSLKNFKI